VSNAVSLRSLDRLRATAHGGDSKDDDEHRPIKSVHPNPPEATR
jgi:hypothetical protein